jgi:hypothetical protein
VSPLQATLNADKGIPASLPLYQIALYAKEHHV